MTETTVRLSLRELAEIPYRALRVAGASHGEAQDGAEAVQFAQIEDGTGLAALIETCQEPWNRAAITLTRSEHSGAAQFDIASAQPLRTLHFGSAVVDLATSAAPNSVVDVTMTGLDACLDNPLRLGALRTGRCVFAAQRRGQTILLRWASAESDLTRGGLDLAAAEDRLGLVLAEGRTRIGTMAFAPEPAGEGARSVPAAQIAARRSEVALTGIDVDRALWAEVIALARGYKQLDKDKKR